LRSLIEAGMANPEDIRWLGVLDAEWGLNGRLALHLPCISQTAPAPDGSEKIVPPTPELADAASRQAGDGHPKAEPKSGAHLHSPSISRPPTSPSVGWEQLVPPRSRRPTPLVVTRRPSG
jgi:hypothetical protein